MGNVHSAYGMAHPGSKGVKKIIASASPVWKRPWIPWPHASIS
jgi:hypothetical protein